MSNNDEENNGIRKGLGFSVEVLESMYQGIIGNARIINEKRLTDIGELSRRIKELEKRQASFKVKSAGNKLTRWKDRIVNRITRKW
jgi:hypothetical protein